ncbi:succinate-semialdehyde dehydrogenase [Actinoplanes lobatus]|uniref:Succinate-semialdehyde dehydrogenase n=1 Tax=Actinoplanes lobatus TaxID=113568 RepID=A0A7W7HIE3_9ACTN|nr:aldehyde dehydrogenase family protein [Actinoplanes lobatus]MBB4751091.1 succinate-semialdehyde dehydrogenase/glutarate-semialdehyde dehydrogenase [Actinoplanes lobatus]GGN92558.1 succinate-semialdehyde dehydrogenase [Actinoplanes lobatus]GIE44969.1 succinate-semialdehyde dehydrogenase [Actinoplanes lobatus]
MPEVVTRDPATGRELGRYPAHDEAAVEQALAETAAAAPGWAATPLGERLALLRTVGKLLTERRDEYAALITAEMGKPLAESLAEIDKCAWNCSVVADLAPEWLADRPVSASAAQSWISYEPLGVIFAVMPWNFPFWQVLRFACAALAAGNTALLKHSPDVTGCALAIEELFESLQPGLFRALVIDAGRVADVSRRIILDPRIAAVTLTGSERAGAAVAEAAGTACKKTVLELGGSDPFVVLADASISAAADAAARSRFGNAGQSCVAAKRFIVVEEVADEFVAALLASLETTQIGPLARADLRDNAIRQIEETVAAGARLLTGGRPVDGPGYFLEPAVLDHVTPGMAAFTEETFGPVAAVVRARDDDHAVALANDTDFGLGCSVWGATGHALAVGRRIRSGALFVNAPVASDPRLPFGGIGRSGHGRELSAEGVREFTNLRTVAVA